MTDSRAAATTARRIDALHAKAAVVVSQVLGEPERFARHQVEQPESCAQGGIPPPPKH
jgi:hypothetical protein